MTLPALTLTFILGYLPLPGIVIAFEKYKYGPFFGLTSKFVGLDNFKFVFMTKAAFEFTRNTILYNLWFIALGTFLGVTFAAMITEIGSRRMAKLYQTISYLPNFLSWIIVSYLFYSFLSPDKGIINHLLMSLGKEPVFWFMEPRYWPFILTIANVWKGLGAGSIIYIAAIAGIDGEMYEAAFMDGATRFKQFWFITLPSLRPMITILVILALGGVFRSDFGLFYFIPRNTGVLYPVTLTLDVYVYNALINNQNFEMSAAAGLYQSVVGFFFILISNLIVRKVSPEYAMF